LYTLGTLDISS